MSHDEPIQDHAEDPDHRFDPAVQSLLAEPAVWDDPPSGLEAQVVDAIGAEAAALPRDHPQERGRQVGGQIVPLVTRRRYHAALAVAAVAAIVAVLALVSPSVLPEEDSAADEGDVAVALEGFGPAEQADARATVTELDNGVRIVLELADLPPAPAGTFYEATLSRPDGVEVTAGSFHMRGGDGRVGLWAGVSPIDYPVLTVSLQDVDDADADTMVLSGTIPG